MDIEKLKNDIALKHGYQDGILGSAWNFAMQLTHRTKRQIALYEEVIEALANSSDENSGLHKPVVIKSEAAVCDGCGFQITDKPLTDGKCDYCRNKQTVL